MIKIIIAFVFLAIFSCLIFQAFARYFYNYKISKDSIRIVLLEKITLFRISFSNIIEIKKISFKEALSNDEYFWALKFGNRIWGEGVLIRRKKGFLKMILITPDRADEFISKVERETQLTHVRDI
jgi:hypothetical protein